MSEVGGREKTEIRSQASGPEAEHFELLLRGEEQKPCGNLITAGRVLGWPHCNEDKSVGDDDFAGGLFYVL